MVTYETEITIDAPPAEVWKQLIDVGRHKGFNAGLQQRVLLAERRSSRPSANSSSGPRSRNRSI